MSCKLCNNKRKIEAVVDFVKIFVIFAAIMAMIKLIF